MLQELLCGQRPFPGVTLDEFFGQIDRCEPRPPRLINDTILRELGRICLNATCARRWQRCTTAADFADESAGSDEALGTQGCVRSAG